MLHAVEGGEGCACRAVSHDHFSALDLVEVEAVERLTHAEEYEVGDVDDVVDGALAYGVEERLEPFGTLGDLYAADGESAVARACGVVVDLYGYRAVDAVGGERVYRGAHGLGGIGMAVEPCGHVAGHAVV